MEVIAALDTTTIPQKETPVRKGNCIFRQQNTESNLAAPGAIHSQFLRNDAPSEYSFWPRFDGIFEVHDGAFLSDALTCSGNPYCKKGMSQKNTALLLLVPNTFLV